jgi:sulfur carrier protein ThiS
MARVFFPDELRKYTNDAPRVEVRATNFRELVAALDGIYPGIAAVISEGVAVAIDGEIIHDPYLEAVGPDSEVHFLHRIAGG